MCKPLSVLSFTLGQYFHFGLLGSASLAVNVYLQKEISFLSYLCLNLCGLVTELFSGYLTVDSFFFFSPSHRRKASEKPDEVSLLP